MNFILNQLSLPTDFEMNAVIPLEGESLMDLLLKLGNDFKEKPYLTQDRVLTSCQRIFMKTWEKQRRTLFRNQRSFIFKFHGSIFAQCESPWSN